MHHILRGIVKSDSPEDVKRNLIENKLIPAASKPMNSNDCQSLLEVSWDLAISGDNGFLQNGGIQVFTAWCKYHRNALTRFFTHSHLTTALTSPEVIHKDKMLQLVAVVLTNMEDNQAFPKMCCVVQTHCVDYLDGCTEALSVTCAMVSLLERFPQCVPKKDQLGKLCSVLTHCVVAAPCPAQAEDLKPYIKDINSVAHFIKSLWTLSEAALRKTLDVVSAILTNSEDRFSPPLAAIVELLPPSLVSTATCSMSHSLSGSADVEPLVRASRRLLRCLAWPGMSSMHLWVTAALRGFVATGRFALITDLFESSVDMVFCRAVQPLTRKCAFPVLAFMLLSYQHSPALFHKVLPHLPLFVKQLQNDPVLQELASLSYTMMYLHSGFPDLYDAVLDALKDVSAPSVDEMQQLLHQYRLASATERYVGGIVGSALVRREAELVGLLNLGNTCYANSVLQALYMTSRLRNQLLQSDTLPPGTILKSLQELFAFLALSQRPAVCPEDFLRTSKPPWFQQGEQQDCSEFLRYLVDSSHEEGKRHGFPLSGSHSAGQTLIQEVFGGVVCTTYHCLTCNGESKNEEAITDLHVAFPEESRIGGSSESKVYQTRSTTKSTEVKNESCQDVTKALALEDMLETYFEPESMEGENRYHCSVCGTLRDARRTVALAEPPRHLVLTLMRFSYDGVTGTRAKILREVVFPQTLALPSNCGLGSNQQPTYILYAVVVHSGTSADRGHYYTYARYSSQMDSNLAYEEAAPGDLVHSSLRDLVDLDNVKYFEEQEAKSKRARWSFKSPNGSDSFDGGPSTGGCGGGGLGLSGLPHMVF
ncbi:ubiquitin carboxyl-terminal hydrolase 35 isoform X2 [Rhipicephalus sanguineus]|uniref:ubiquitin carboxyl-terminal hydrolase 35 isoform X2 n=1 Tax=Rhipicephalus sanguineus TaxID=34632 RepID=UPI0020C20E9E|nr:ubiquitin carboxyl-terminal hydrolase 35 isoform X2 [Rhipicephalus sanguineus]